MTAPTLKVVDCDCCCGRGVVLAVPVPAGPEPRTILCPLCTGLGARLVAA